MLLLWHYNGIQCASGENYWGSFPKGKKFTLLIKEYHTNQVRDECLWIIEVSVLDPSPP